jgi:hypothetical protein
MLDDLRQTEFLDQRLFLAAIGGRSGLPPEVIADGAFTDIQLPSNSTFRLAFLSKNLKCHDFILCQFRHPTPAGIVQIPEDGRGGDFGY